MIAELLSKPAEFVVVMINSGQIMSYGGSFEPCCHVRLMSIGSLGDEINRGYAAKISEFITEELGVQANRTFIEFVNSDKNWVGWNGDTFHFLGKPKE